MIATTEPISTVEEIERVVDIASNALTSRPRSDVGVARLGGHVKTMANQS
jgi:hypothetical protein